MSRRRQQTASWNGTGAGTPRGRRRRHAGQSSVVELSVNWPARLGGTCPLQFVAAGRVVRSEAKKAVVRFDRYGFKTRRGPPAADAGA